MGTGDLNLLKSWNPKLVKNRKKVWEREQELLQEDEQLKRRQREIELEQEEKELLNGRDSSTKSKNGMEWMYQDDPTEKEDYLLGKKKLDTTVIHKSEPEPEVDNSTNLKKKTNKPDSVYAKDDPMAMFSRKKTNKVNKVNKVVKQVPNLTNMHKTTTANKYQTKQQSKPQKEVKTDLKKRIQEELDY